LRSGRDKFFYKAAWPNGCIAPSATGHVIPLYSMAEGKNDRDLVVASCTRLHLALPDKNKSLGET
jgi:hypothetical protein